MLMKDFTKYNNIIRTTCPDVISTHEPKVTGALNNVVFANTPNDAYVFKFGNADIIRKNEAASRLYNIREIPVPQITAMTHNETAFEMYKKIPGITLFEAINQGIGAQQIKDVYREILGHFAKMSRMYPSLLPNFEMIDVHQIAKQNITDVNSNRMGQLFMMAVYLLNMGDRQNKAIYHSDITPKNIIVSDTGVFTGLIDIDNVCVCDKNYAFGAMAAKYQEIGFDAQDLIQEYEKNTSDNINPARIKAIAKLHNMGKRILWRHKTNKQQTR